MFLSRLPFALLLALLSLMGCSSTRSASAKAPATTQIPRISIGDETPPDTTKPTLPPSNAKTPKSVFPVMLGIDVLEQRGFEILKGKRVGLLTHQAGVNRRGETTLDVLRRAPGVKLVALYAGEHGLRGEISASQNFNDHVDPKTGLMVYSLYTGKSRWATPAQLKPIDVLVIDLQDIGSRSYTFISAMRYALESCFKAGKEVVVLDRPNPLGGLKVDGPPMDQAWMSYVGAFRIPYVHGLTMGELARLSKELPGTLDLPDEIREKGRLTVIPMQGWRRSMRWPDTGLRWVPTSPKMPDYPAALGYAMTGLGCIVGGFHSGVGDQHIFRGIGHKTVKDDVLERDLKALKLPGLRFQRISVPNKQGQPATGIYIEIVDFDDWRPTELSFHLMKLACRYDTRNPFAPLPTSKANSYLIHMGSTAFFEAIKKDGSRVDVDFFIRDWQLRSKNFQQASKRFRLYP
jgi:uncharacterized protein YbbC (DUF1343 family)